jgi:hypothetical protein
MTALSQRIKALSDRRAVLVEILQGVSYHSDLAAECRRRVDEYDAKIAKARRALAAIERLERGDGRREGMR